MARNNLRNSSDILRLLNRVFNQLENDEIENDKARVLIYCLNTASSVLKVHTLEDRLEYLEKQAEQKGA